MMMPTTSSNITTPQGISLQGMQYFVDKICGGLHNIPPQLTVRYAFHKYLLPATRGSMSSFADILADGNTTSTTQNTVLVAISWQDSFKQVMLTIFNFYEQQKDAKTTTLFCWIDFFCMNYHHEAYSNPMSRVDWIGALQDVYLNIGHCLVVVTNWHHSIAAVCQNMTVLLQIYISTIGYFQFDLLMLPYVENDLYHEIHAYSALQRMLAEDVEKADEMSDDGSSLSTVVPNMYPDNTKDPSKMNDVSGITFNALFPHMSCHLNMSARNSPSPTTDTSSISSNDASNDASNDGNAADISGPVGYAEDLLTDFLPNQESQSRFVAYLQHILDNWLHTFIRTNAQKPHANNIVVFATDFHRISTNHEAIAELRKVHLQVTQLMVAQEYDEAERVLLNLLQDQKRYLKVHVRNVHLSRYHGYVLEYAHTLQVLIDLFMDTKKWVLAEMMMIALVDHLHTLVHTSVDASNVAETTDRLFCSSSGTGCMHGYAAVNNKPTTLLYLEALQQLAYLYYVHKHHKQAINWLTRYHQEVVDLLGKEHMMALQALFLLSEVFRQCDQYDDALQSAQHCHHLARQQYGVDHSCTKLYFEQIQRIRQMHSLSPATTTSNSFSSHSNSSSRSSSSSSSGGFGRLSRTSGKTSKVLAASSTTCTIC